MIKRVDRRLAVWKGRYLSKGSKLILLKSVLSNLLVYFMSLFMGPMLVIHKLERIRRDFLWHSTDGEHKFHLMRWNLICSPFSEGGLSIRSLKAVNRALLNKRL